MKKILAISILALAATSCSFSPSVVVYDEGIRESLNEEALVCETPNGLLYKIGGNEFKQGKRESRKIKDAYSRIVKFPQDEELMQFTTTFFKVLEVSEKLELESLTLKDTEKLPNISGLKFFYRAERELNREVEAFQPFVNSSNKMIKECAQEAEKYFNSQKEYFMALRDIDYNTLFAKEMPEKLPSDVLKAHAKRLEQRDQTFPLFLNFYSKLAEAKSKS